MNSGQIPAHSQVGLGQDFNPTAAEFFSASYSTGNIAKTVVTGLRTGLSYHLHRNTGHYFADHDPEKSQGNHADWNNSLVLDVVGGTSRTYAFSPNANDSLVRYRGHGLDGGRFETFDDFAWTVWVR